MIIITKWIHLFHRLLFVPQNPKPILLLIISIYFTLSHTLSRMRATDVVIVTDAKKKHNRIFYRPQCVFNYFRWFDYGTSTQQFKWSKTDSKKKNQNKNKFIKTLNFFRFSPNTSAGSYRFQKTNIAEKNNICEGETR